VTHRPGVISETSRVATIRRANAEDGPFLQEMLALAANWRPDARVSSVTEIMGEPALARYVADWPAAGDVGFVVEHGRPVGAAWWRLFPEHDHGYGFVDADTPELSIGVAAEARGRGFGTLLLKALIDEARRRALPALSLSVEPDTPAAALYQRLGFVTIGRVGGSFTMTLKLVA
jgi:GNAT superfamily N-acetyltransferase